MSRRPEEAAHPDSTVTDPPAVYERLAERLRASPPSPSVTALPDGSVDYQCRVEVGAHGTPESREALGEAIAAGEHKSLRIVPERGEPGGQAVNLAAGADAVGGDVTLFGHLDGPEMPTFGFSTHSMGSPATVRILGFDDGALMLAEESADILTWTFDDLTAAAPSAAAVDAALRADAVACCNWVSFPNMPDALRALTDRAVAAEADGVFLLDPGDVVGSDPEAVAEILAVLGRLGDAYDVVLNANAREIRALADALPGAPTAETAAADDARLRLLREAADIAAVTLHARSRAAMATADGVVSVPNLAVGSPERWTGGGDRFGAGLALGLGAGWDPADALALGNTAASYYVDRGEGGDAEALAAFAAHPEYHLDPL